MLKINNIIYSKFKVRDFKWKEAENLPYPTRIRTPYSRHEIQWNIEFVLTCQHAYVDYKRLRQCTVTYGRQIIVNSQVLPKPKKHRSSEHCFHTTLFQRLENKILMSMRILGKKNRQHGWRYKYWISSAATWPENQKFKKYKNYSSWNESSLSFKFFNKKEVYDLHLRTECLRSSGHDMRSASASVYENCRLQLCTIMYMYDNEEN